MTPFYIFSFMFNQGKCDQFNQASITCVECTPFYFVTKHMDNNPVFPIQGKQKQQEVYQTTGSPQGLQWGNMFDVVDHNLCKSKTKKCKHLYILADLGNLTVPEIFQHNSCVQ